MKTFKTSEEINVELRRLTSDRTIPYRIQSLIGDCLAIDPLKASQQLGHVANLFQLRAEMIAREMAAIYNELTTKNAGSVGICSLPHATNYDETRKAMGWDYHDTSIENVAGNNLAPTTKAHIVDASRTTPNARR